MSETSADPDLLRETAEDLLANAERCYRLARATTEHRTRERLLDLAREFEERAKVARTQARR